MPELRKRVADYVQISKPRIIFLLLIVAWAAMFMAEGGLPPLVPFVAVSLAGTFSTAAAGAYNCIIERDRDARMDRTASRPLASGRISVAGAATYATIMAILAIASLGLADAWLAAALTAGAIAYYVLVYTVVLKPSTPQNIVIGGFAGSFPALIGWSATTGGLGWSAWVLALLVFLWTPAHFWALALLYREDYAAADFPMMPNVRGEAHTRILILVYSILTLFASVAFVFLGTAGLVYLVAALFLGGVLVARAAKLLREHGAPQYRSFFFYTIQYLGVLLVVLMVDRLATVPVL